MKKRFWIFVVAFSMLLPFFLQAAEPFLEIDFQKAVKRWSNLIPENWEQSVPLNAQIVQINTQVRADLRQLATKKSDSGVLYFQIDSNEAGEACIDVGCDGRLEACMNGKLLVSNWDKKSKKRVGAWNNPVRLSVNKGSNLLAIKVMKGSNDWSFHCTNIPGEVFEPVTEKLTPFKKTTVNPVSRTGDTYRLIVFGDTHYDRVEYHQNLSAEKHPSKIKEMNRNVDMWTSRMGRMLDAAAKQVNGKTRAVIQVGDIIQGDADTPEVHKKMLNDVLAVFAEKFPSIPILPVMGNHDFRSPDGRNAYASVMFPHLTQATGTEVSGTTFYFTMGQDLFLFIDFTFPDIGKVFEAFDKNPDARYKFVVSHGSVLPTDNKNFTWYLWGKDADWLRNRMRNEFLSNQVIALAGHTHSGIELIDCVAQEGRITQLIACSVWSRPELIATKKLFNNPSLYGSRQTDEAMKKRYTDLEGTIKEYYRAESVGYFVLDVSPDKVRVAWYAGDNPNPVYRYDIQP